MRICTICHQPFQPAQTFENLFRMRHICEVCEVMIETPVKKSVFPMEHSECHLYTFDGSFHPAHFKIMMEEVVLDKRIELLFKDSVTEPKPTVWHLLSKLFDPLNLFASHHLSLDEMARMIE